MRKKLVGLLLFCIPLLAKAQIVINVLLPPAGMIQKDQLWNLAITNNNGTPANIYIGLLLQDAKTGQTVLTAGTRTLLIGNGLKMIQARDLQPVQYNNTATGFEGSFLPLGSYIACYTVNQANGKSADPLARECVRMNILPLSPPLLNTPADKSTLPTPWPRFTWSPPTAVGQFDQLRYDITVVEQLPGQSAKDAVLYNNPLYSLSGLRQPVADYPSSTSKLETNKEYAWQVTARNGDSWAANTDAWTFKVGNDTVKSNVLHTTYIQLKSTMEPNGVSLISGDQLVIKYYSFDKEHTAQLQFTTDDSKGIYETNQRLQYGDNYFSIKLNRHFRKGTVYHISITDLKNSIYTAAFRIQ